MPKKIANSRKSASKKSSISSSPIKVFTDSHFKLQLIIIAFLVLSALLVLHLVNQQQEIDFYKSVARSTANTLNAAK